ncbi:hypothetical protein ARMGADRAFT_457070 [Armillaria gallica]|uniref:Uncharacterized protein n=1 Tax=Armillaria gallica TaxID=47427 RepID=A0A2H3DGW8_ARMGA|nr:hypothetical protein ARMGADRAFT_457070 [Armillaria gallica]
MRLLDSLVSAKVLPTMDSPPSVRVVDRYVVYTNARGQIIRGVILSTSCGADGTVIQVVFRSTDGRIMTASPEGVTVLEE